MNISILPNCPEDTFWYRCHEPFCENKAEFAITFGSVRRNLCEACLRQLQEQATNALFKHRVENYRKEGPASSTPTRSG
jgi:hypothetical protein